MGISPIAALLTDIAQPVPLYLTSFVAAATFTPAYKGSEDRSVISDAFSELDALLKAGFFAWRHMDARSRAGVVVEWRDDGFAVIGEGAGLHHNLLVVVLRMIVSLHHTPAESRQALVAALGDDAAALPPAAHWADALAAIRLSGIEGFGVAARTGFDDFEIDGEIIVPQELDLESDGARRIVRASGAEPILDQKRFKAVENDFLAVCNTGGFRSLSQLDEMPEEGEFFFRSGEAGRELVVDEYRDAAYGLIEFLNVLTNGRNAELVVR